MKRRHILKNTWLLGITGLITWVSARTSNTLLPSTFASTARDPFEINHVNDILLQLFETDQAIYDASIKIDVPMEAENAQFVPFRISTIGAERIAIIVNENATPLLMTVEGDADQTNKNDLIKVISATMRLESASHLSCYVIKQGELFQNSRYIDIAQPGFVNG